MQFAAIHAPDFGAKMQQNGVLFHGLEVMGGGSILTGLVLGAIGVFVIDRKFVNAAGFALSGAILTFFGFMHGDAIGLGVTPGVAFAYLVVAGFLFGIAKYSTAEGMAPKAMPAPAE
jgi:AGZA family xanthine/uracil permease-like MFS transporter